MNETELLERIITFGDIARKYKLRHWKIVNWDEFGDEMKAIVKAFDDHKRFPKESLVVAEIRKNPKENKNQKTCPYCGVRFYFRQVKVARFENVALGLKMHFCSVDCKLQWIYAQQKVMFREA